MNAKIATGFTEGALSARLFYRHLPTHQARAHLVIVHGFGEHSGRYETLMTSMAAYGVGSLAIDYRGHGRADGRRGHVNRFEEYLQDLDSALELADRLGGGGRLIIVGHSVGGLILATRLQRPRPEAVVGAIMSSPSIGFKLKVSAWKDAVGVAAASLWPALTMSAGVDPSLLTHDAEIVGRYRRDPLVVGEVTARWYQEAQGAQKSALDGAGFIDLPLLVMQAGDDRIADPAVAKCFADAVSSATYHEFPGMYHEIFNERDRAQVYARMVAFIDELLG